MEIKKEIENILFLGDGDGFDDAYNIYNLIIKEESQEQQTDLFQYVCENYGLEEPNKSLKTKSAPYKEDKKELKDKYVTILNSILKTYLREDYGKKEFYTKLWKTIQDSCLFEDEAAKVFAVYYIIIDKRIPYFELDRECRYQLSNEKFRGLRSKYKKDLLKIRFILFTEFSQKTEKASTLLNELGIRKPDSDAKQEDIEEYERKLIMMVEMITQENPYNICRILRKYGKK